MKIEEIASRLATIKKSLQATDLHTLTLRVEEVEKLIEEYTSQLWTSPCICTPDEKTGETLCCNHCGRPTARRESKELPGDIYTLGMHNDEIETDEELTGFEIGAKQMRSIASPLLASKDARIRELEEALRSIEIGADPRSEYQAYSWIDTAREIANKALTPPKN